jgi:hypothetical protein
MKGGEGVCAEEELTVNAGIGPAAAILGGASTETRTLGDGGREFPREEPGVKVKVGTVDVLCAVPLRGPDLEPLGVAENEGGSDALASLAFPRAFAENWAT